MNNKLNLESLEKAIISFKKAIDEYGLDQSNEFVRDAVIQRFEYSYELTTKIIARYLSLIVADPSSINELSFPEIIRMAYTKGIIKNSWDRWKEYRHDRNQTSHGYDENHAIEIAQHVVLFYNEAIFLLETLKTKSIE